MYSQDLESSVLRLARERGLLAGAGPEDLDAASLVDPELLDRSSCYGPRLDRMLMKGLLSRKAVESLVWEVVLGAAPEATAEASWTLGPIEAASDATPEAPDPSLSGRFMDSQLVGEGATAWVYKVFDPELQRWVALKLLKTRHSAHQELLLAEARAQAKVEHPNVCRIHEVGRLGDHGYILMEFARGATLAHAMSGLEPVAKVRLLRDIAEGIHAAHRQGLVHLDLKPGNILLQPKEDGGYRPLISDFGMVLSEEPGKRGRPSSMGTPPYSSPEQITGRPGLPDRRSDVYSLGVVLYVALCGKLPFEAADLPGLLEAIEQKEPVPLRKRDPKLSPDLEAIVAACMAKDPERRYASALLLADDLERFLSGEPVRAYRSDRVYRLRKWIQRHRALTAVAVAAILVCSVFAVLGAGMVWRVKTQARLAKDFQQQTEDVEAILRSGYGMPFHDITPEVKLAEARMASIRARMAQEGKLAEGPGNYALGRAELAMGDPERAQELLQKAWDADFRTSEEAAALGSALGLVYERQLAEYSSLQPFEISDPGTVNEIAPGMLRHLRQAYAEPSQRYLAMGGSALAPEQWLYFDGLGRLHEDSPETTVQRAHQVSGLAPWSLESSLLEIQAERILVSESLARERFAEAEEALARMEAAVQRAESLQRSAPAAFQAEAQYRYLSLCLRVARHQAEPSDLAMALESTEKCLKVDPGDWRAYAQRATVYLAWADNLKTRGEDPRPPLRSSVEASEAALKLRPDSAWALNLEGTALNDLCVFDWRFYGQDGRQYARRAIGIYGRLMERTLFKDQACTSLGFSHGLLGLYAATAGEPGGAAELESSIAWYQRSLDLNPSSKASFEMGTPYKWLGLLKAWQGGDPLSDYGKAIEAYRRSLTVSAQIPITWGRLADLYALRAERLLLSGKDPSQDVGQAVESCRRCIGLRPDFYLGHVNLGEALLVQARWEMRQGRSPAQDLDTAEQELREALKWHASDPAILHDLGVLEREQLRWALASGGPAQRHLEQGLQWVATTLRLNPSRGQTCLLKAELLLLAARQGGAQAPRWRGEAAHAAEQAVVFNPYLRLDAARVLQDRD